MGNKVKHELISHEPSRKVTLRRRKASLLRKLNEITTLCGVVACALVYDSSDTKMDVWPSSQEAFYVLEKFKKLPEKRQVQFMMDQKSFLEKNISKLNAQLERARLKNQRLDVELLLIEYLEGKTVHDCSRLESFIELDTELDKRIDLISKMTEFKEGHEPAQVYAETDSDEMVEHGTETDFVHPG